MLVLAHRGAHGEPPAEGGAGPPENSLAAFRAARGLGADGVELDVRRTADGVLVVRHDAVTAAGPVSGLRRAELAAAEPDVPTLAEALDACAGMVVNAEVKNSPGDPDWDPSAAVADALVGLLDDRGNDDVFVSSFDLATLDRVRMLAPGRGTGLLTFDPDPLALLATVSSHGHTGLHPHVRSLAGARLGALVRRAHDLGIRVVPWTVNDPEEIRRLAAASTDAVVTDLPAAARAALDQGTTTVSDAGS